MCIRDRNNSAIAKNNTTIAINNKTIAKNGFAIANYNRSKARCIATMDNYSKTIAIKKETVLPFPLINFQYIR